MLCQHESTGVCKRLSLALSTYSFRQEIIVGGRDRDLVGASLKSNVDRWCQHHRKDYDNLVGKNLTIQHTTVTVCFWAFWLSSTFDDSLDLVFSFDSDKREWIRIDMG